MLNFQKTSLLELNRSSNAIFFLLETSLVATANDQVVPTYPYGYGWIVEDLNVAPYVFKMDNPSNWWIGSNAVPNTFRDFNNSIVNYSGHLTDIVPRNVLDSGRFAYGHQYRITRATWNDVCTTWTPYSMISNPSPHPHRTANGNPEIVFVEDKNAPDFLHLKEQMIAEAARSADLFSVYPNPSNGIFTIALGNENKATMEVIDITGRTIKTVQLTKNDRYILDLSGYAKGIYLIKMNGDTQQMKKIILE